MSDEPEDPVPPVETPPEPQPIEPTGELDKVQILEARIAELNKRFEQLPKDLEAAFTNYHSKIVLPLIQQKATQGGGDVIGQFLGLAKQAMGGGEDSAFQSEIQDMTKQVVSLALRGTIRTMTRNMGLPDHVQLE